MTSIRISEMQKFHFGSEVMCSDGEVGSLAHVVFDAASRHLTHLEVKEGYLFGKTFDLPYDTVVEATGDGVILRFTRTELAAASVVAVGGAVLDHRSLVEYTRSGDKGTLLLIAVHPENGALAYLVVHHLRPERDILLLERYVTGIVSGHVTVTLPDVMLNELPLYRPDEELLTIMVHDLRDYLTPLKGRLQRMERRAYREGREQDMHDVTAAANTLNLLGRVISDLLDVAHLNRGIFTIRPQPINMVDLVQEVVPAFSRPETPIHVHALEEVMLAADPDRLRQVLENLLANAVKYALDHTPITVQVDREKRTDGPWMLLTVSNAGPGITPELRAQFLHPFVAGVKSTGWVWDSTWQTELPQPTMGCSR